MKPPRAASACALIMLAAGNAQLAAETVYITNELRVGMHEERTLDSPIIKLIPSGAALEIVKKDNALSFVRDPEGATGWVDNSYLKAQPPAGSVSTQELERRSSALEQRLAEAKQRIQELEAQAAVAAPAGASGAGQVRNLATELEIAEQQLKEERLRAGELQVQIAELKKRIGLNSDNASLYEEIDRLEAENKKLEIALAGSAGAIGVVAAGPPDRGKNPGPIVQIGAGRLAAFVVLILIVGFGGGVYFLDYINRRRHGGFRI